MPVTSRNYGKLPSGESVSLFELSNQNGLVAEITNYGGILVSLHVPDRDGRLADIVLGKDTLDGYVQGHPCFGSICGRVAGRIGGARFEIDGQPYALEANENGTTNLHSGPEGFHLMLWEPEIVAEGGVEKLRLRLHDPDGHNGFPGNVVCTVTYALHDDDRLEIQYAATTDRASPFNPTNHSYFNLRAGGDVLDHQVRIYADETAAVNAQGCLNGQRIPVIAGYNDYRDFVQLGSLAALEPGNANAYYFLNKGRTIDPELAAVVKEPTSGRILEVWTCEPGVQFYAGLALSEDSPETGKRGAVHGPCHGLCLETEDYPDSVNFPDMGGAILRPETPFHSTTCFRFTTECHAEPHERVSVSPATETHTPWRLAPPKKQIPISSAISTG